VVVHRLYTRSLHKMQKMEANGGGGGGVKKHDRVVMSVLTEI
jgi:hypothetical protein